MLKRLLPAFAVLLIALVLCSPPPRASAAATVAVSMFQTTAGNGPDLAFSGQLKCMAQINQQAGVYQATPQYSTDDVNWVTADAINGGTLGTTGVFIGTVPVGPGYTHFRLFFNKFAAVYISGQLACGDALPPTYSAGGGQVNSVVASPPITVDSTDPTAPIVGCGILPLSCATVFWGPSYGMTPDSGVTDNGAALTSAVTAACAVGGGIIEVPYSTGNVYGFTTAVRITCSNIMILGFGQGAALGTGHFPTRINGATIFKAYGSLSGSPLLSLWPTSANEQAGNAVVGVQFDGNSNGTSADLATTGLYITGQFEPYTDRLSFTHFSGPAIHWQGSQIGGSVKGSVVSPHMGDLEMSQPSAWDGPCATIDALAVGSTDWGDVFGGDSGGSFHCNAWNWPGVIIGRSDHLNLPFMQINNPPGAPISPSPSPGSTTTPTPYPQLAIICGAIENHFSGVVMGQVQQYRAESTNAASPEPSCSPPGNDPKGTTFSSLQTYGNSAMLPGITVGNITFHDDNGDIVLQSASGSAFTPYFCLAIGSGAQNSSTCPVSSFLISNDNLGNMLIGTRGNAAANIYFCPSGGCGPGQPFTGGAGTSQITAQGCYQVPGVTPPTTPPTPTPPPNASEFCPGFVDINNSSSIAATFSNGLWSGNSGNLVGITTNGAMTPVPSPPPAAYFAVTSTPAPATFHGSAFSCTFVAAASCPLGANYWSGSARFTSSTSIYGCSVATSATDGVTFVFNQTGIATGTLYASASNSDTVTGICWGT